MSLAASVETCWSGSRCDCELITLVSQALNLLRCVLSVHLFLNLDTLLLLLKVGIDTVGFLSDDLPLCFDGTNKRVNPKFLLEQ